MAKEIQKYSIFTCIQKLNIKSAVAEKRGKEGEDDWTLYFSTMQYLKQLKDLTKKDNENIIGNKGQINRATGRSTVNASMTTYNYKEEVKAINNKK